MAPHGISFDNIYSAAMADVEEGTIYRVKAELEDDYTSVSKCLILDYS